MWLLLLPAPLCGFVSCEDLEDDAQLLAAALIFDFD